MKLSDKIDHALQESRMLVLGAQVLLGFGFQAVFLPRFDALPPAVKAVKLAGLGLMLFIIGLLFLPGARHRLVERGEDSPELHAFVSRVMDLVLFPFALAIGADFFVAGHQVGGFTAGAILGGVTTAGALGSWYLLQVAIRSRGGAPRGGTEMEPTELTQKVKHLLTETRVVLPGVQALLGFQLVILFQESFERLPASSKWVHLASLALTGVAIVLLMSPAAYHRIVERGNDTERFHTFGTRMVVASLVPIGLGMCGDLFVVVRKVTGDEGVAVAAAAVVAAFFGATWFGLTLFLRARWRRRGGSAVRHPAHARA